MSKVQEKESTLLNTLSSKEVANELDSHLRDLEKNIAVAREFIKLVDESYSDLRHKWNMLSEKVWNKPQTYETEHPTLPEGKEEMRPRTKDHTKTDDKNRTEANEHARQR